MSVGVCVCRILCVCRCVCKYVYIQNMYINQHIFTCKIEYLS